MQSFEWIDATSIEHAASLLSEEGVVAKAGGIDLLDLMKEGIVTPKRVINLNLIDELRGISVLRQAQDERPSSGGLRIGALTTLAEIAVNPIINTHFSALAQSAAHAATPQVRNAATIGGNLLQRPRCWYFRNRQLQKSADTPQLQEREHQYHAIFDNVATAMVHASTPATALIAYGATVHLKGPGGERSILVKDFLLSPNMVRDRDASIARDEILTHISIPATSPSTRAAYHKQTERDSYDWPLFDVAIVLTTKGRIVESSSIVLGSVAPTPMHALASEAIIKGRAIDEAVATEAARAAIRGATPFSSNAYKVPMLEAVLRRTLLTVGA
jgi:xanthine dehydrogenase YagS FAD-binding subunit